MPLRRSQSERFQDFPGYFGRFSIPNIVYDNNMKLKRTRSQTEINNYNQRDRPFRRNWEPPVDYQESLPLDKKWRGSIQNHRQANSSTSSDQDDDSNGNPKTIKRVLVRFAERTSMQGIPYINVSKVWYAKVIWTILYLMALAGMSVHMYVLITTYLTFGTHAKVKLTFSNIKFPTVTVCNVNPIRSSQLHLASQELRQFVHSINPQRITPTSGKRITPTSGKPRKLFENLPFNITNKRPTLQDRDKNSRRFSGEKSGVQTIKEEFYYLFSSHDRQTRVDLGHSIDDMLVSCSYSGVSCNASHFRIHPTSTFGNCYTLENADFVSYRGGPIGGLELILFLQAEEYLSTIAPGHGAQIQIHDTNTWPDPEVQGMAISAAMETSIAMRMIQIERLGKPHGSCEDGNAFKVKYGRKYTRQTCNLFCEQKEIVSRCACYDEEKHELQSSIGTDVDGSRIQACRNKTEQQCMLSVMTDWETGDFNCPCLNPCSETSYQRLSHSRTWPSVEYATLLVQHLCNSMNQSECDRHQNMDTHTLGRNFLKVNIYFEDLNYEEVTEAPDYEDVQFLSDIGGTVGLWIGLSVLSLAEVLQFFSELVHFLICVRPNRKNMSGRREDVTERSSGSVIGSSRDHTGRPHTPRFRDMKSGYY